jgi:hypothetical protein
LHKNLLKKKLAAFAVEKGRTSGSVAKNKGRANNNRPTALTVAIITASTTKVKNLLVFFRKTLSPAALARRVGETA